MRTARMNRIVVIGLSICLGAPVVHASSLEDGLIAWWRMELKVGSTISDASGKGHDLTILGSPTFDGNIVIFDDDGVPEAEDECLDSDLSPTIVIDECDTGVENQLLEDGCTMVDLIALCAEGVTEHGAFVRCVAHLTNFWKCNSLISGQNKGHIQGCAAQADVP